MALDILGPSLFGERFKKPFYLEEDDDLVISEAMVNKSFMGLLSNPLNKPPPVYQKTQRQNSARSYEDVDGLIPLKSCLYVPEGDTGKKVPIKKSKSVHFADSCGLALTSVLPFVDSDLGSENQNTGITTRKSYPGFEKLKGRNLGERESKSRLVNFVQPIARPDFSRRVDMNNVSLENITFREYSIFGTVRVKNISFEKSVFVKFTTDCWTTCDKVIADFVPGSSTGNTDCFSFELLAKQEAEESDVKFEFCVCFESAGQQFWDNNFGDNYRLVCHRKSRPLNESVKFVGKFSLSLADSKLIGWAA